MSEMNETIMAALAAAEVSCGVKAHEYADVPASLLVFSREFFDTCATNACGHYNKSWTCPPATGTMEEQCERILAYKNVFVFTTMHTLEDSFDYEGMSEGRELHLRLTLELYNSLGNQFPFYSAGGCPLCKDKDGNSRCAYPDPCRFPEKKIDSMEAAGINVTELSRAAGIRYNNGPNTVTYFSFALWG
jgi:predicted metal-binding protein